MNLHIYIYRNTHTEMYSIIYIHIYKHTRTQTHNICIYYIYIYITIYNIHIRTVHGIHGWFAINESMDKIQENVDKGHPIAASSNLPIYCCISTSSTSTYQYLLWWGWPQGHQFELWIPVTWTPQDGFMLLIPRKIQSDHSKLMQIDELIMDRG